MVHVLPEGASPQDADRDGLVCDDWPHCGLLGGVSRQVEYQGMQAMSETPQEPNRYTEYFGVETTGSRIGLMVCRDCGATILLGDEQADAPKIHDEWHKSLEGEP